METDVIAEDAFLCITDAFKQVTGRPVVFFNNGGNPVEDQIIKGNRHGTFDCLSGIALVLEHMGKFIADFTALIKGIGYVVEADSAYYIVWIFLQKHIKTNSLSFDSHIVFKFQ